MKILSVGVVVVLVLVVLGYLFRAPLIEFATDQMTADMYVGEDQDAFDPGLAVGSSFPQIEARYQGSVVQGVANFPVDKGMIFIANRSVDW